MEKWNGMVLGKRINEGKLKGLGKRYLSSIESSGNNNWIKLDSQSINMVPIETIKYIGF